MQPQENSLLRWEHVYRLSALKKSLLRETFLSSVGMDHLTAVCHIGTTPSHGISLAGMKLPNAPFRFAADEYLIPIPKANSLLYNRVLFEEDLYAVVASFMSHTSITSP